MKNIFKAIIVYLLSKESQAILKKYQPKIIAITGTVGKTSTRDAVYTALSQFESVRKSPKNFNTEIGIPLTILDAENGGSNPLSWSKVLLEGLLLILLPSLYPKWLVLEVGTDRPGDIEGLSKWLRPDVVIVTKLSAVPVHVEAFGMPEDLFEEKGFLVKALKAGGLLILNAEDKEVMKYKDLTKESVMTFGGGENYEIVYENNLPTGVRFEVGGQTINLFGTLGKQHIQHASVALAVMKLLGEDLQASAKALSGVEPTAGRMRLIEGLNSSVLIDDTYNSSPVAVEEALKSLKAVKSKRKIAILGDMLELGRYTADEHRKAGELARKCAKILVTVGVRAKLMAGDYHFSEAREAGKFMKDLIKPGDTILIKGSQGMRMEKCVEELMAHREDKGNLLVRQGIEWKNK